MGFWDETRCKMAAALGLKSIILCHFTFVLVPDVEDFRPPIRGDTFSLTGFERRANRVVLVPFLFSFTVRIFTRRLLFVYLVKRL